MRASGEVQYIMYVAGPFAALQALGAVLPETELLDSHPDQAASRVVEPFQRSHSILNSYFPPQTLPSPPIAPFPAPSPFPGPLLLCQLCMHSATRLKAHASAKVPVCNIVHIRPSSMRRPADVDVVSPGWCGYAVGPG